MNAAYIERWNETVGDNDTVYHLGDLCFGAIPQVQEIVELLQGSIILVPGNHDRWVAEYGRLKEQSSEYELYSKSGHPFVVNWNQIQEINTEHQRIVLCHFPMRSWNASYHGSWHLYGHVHTKLKPWGMSMDVGVDAHDGYPIALSQVASYMEERRKDLDKIWNSKDGTDSESERLAGEPRR